MGVSAFRGALKTALTAQAGIAVVYDYPESNFKDGFPAVVVNSAGWTNEFNDTSRNMICYHFELYLFQGINSTTPESIARTRIDDLADTLLTLFNPQTHFGGAILTKPLKGDPPSLVDRPNPMIMSKMTIDFVTLQAR